VGLRIGIDENEKKNVFTMPGLKIRPLGRPVRLRNLISGTDFNLLHLLHVPFHMNNNATPFVFFQYIRAVEAWRSHMPSKKN
jgi:hypothetical protein